MLTFKEYTNAVRNSTPDLPKLPRLEKLPKLPKMNRPVNRENRPESSGLHIQRLGSAEAVVHLQRVIAHLSMLIRRLSQE